LGHSVGFAGRRIRAHPVALRSRRGANDGNAAMAARNGLAPRMTVLASSSGLDPERCLRGKVADDAAGTGKRTRMSGRSSERAGWPRNVKETDRKRRRKFAGFHIANRGAWPVPLHIIARAAVAWDQPTARVALESRWPSLVGADFPVTFTLPIRSGNSMVGENRRGC
jgi:hypothetical protein